MTSKSHIVLYHGNCLDGFAAALAAKLVLGDTADYIPCLYDDFIPEVAGKHVFILDYSFSPEVIQKLAETALSLTMLDHHATAHKKLSQFKLMCCGKIHFDMSKSGASLSWEHFHPGTTLPYLFKCIETQDLWKWSVEGAPAFLKWLECLPRTFENWEQILAYDETKIQECIKIGSYLLAYHASMCEAVIKGAAPLTLKGVQGLAINASHFFTNDVGSAMAKQSGTFGLIFKIDGNQVRCSLRSVAPYNVLPIAEAFGGGGHPQAAAFRIDVNDLPQFLAGTL